MPSSKGKPTDPQLREKVKEEIKNKTNKDGSGKGQWSAWKAAELSKEYEARGGRYENSPGSKNEPRKGTPTPKHTDKKKKEEERVDQSSPASKENNSKGEAKENAKPRANTNKKQTTLAGETKKERTQSVGARKSARVAEKRKRGSDESGGEKKARK